MTQWELRGWLRWRILGTGIVPWRSRFICLLILPSSFLWCIVFPFPPCQAKLIGDGRMNRQPTPLVSHYVCTDYMHVILFSVFTFSQRFFENHEKIYQCPTPEAICFQSGFIFRYTFRIQIRTTFIIIILQGPEECKQNTLTYIYKVRLFFYLHEIFCTFVCCDTKIS